MHIVHINFSITMGGIDTMLIDILNEQVKENKTSLIVINNKIHDIVLNNIDKRVTIYKINRTPGSLNIFKILNLNAILFKIKPSIIHCHNSKVINYIFLRKIPSILTVHALNYSSKSYHSYNKIIAISKSVEKDVLQKGDFFTGMIYNGIHHSIIQKKTTYSLNSIFNIIIIGRLECETKGQDLILDALHILKTEYSLTNIHVDFFGDGNSEQKLRDMVINYELSNQVSFLGIKSREYIYNNLKNYDLLIQPSRFEGFGLTVAEAISAEIPVLVSANDGPMEIIDNGKYGYFFEKENTNDLASKIIHIYKLYENENNKIKQTCIEAYNFVKDNFDIKNTARNYIKEYLKLLQ